VTSRIVQSGHDFRKVGKIFITPSHATQYAPRWARLYQSAEWLTL